MHNIFIFDVDGVLVDPRGYRAAVSATINHYTTLWGWGALGPDEPILESYEAQAIISEWDMLPIMLASLLDQSRREFSGVPLPANLENPFEDRILPALQNHNYLAPVISLGESGCNLRPPALLVRKLQHDKSPHRPFPFLDDSPILDQLFADTRNIFSSPVTRMFQEFVLGSHQFENTYGIPPTQNAESLLQLHDIALIPSDYRDLLLDRVAQKQLDLGIYTARPSLSPLENPYPVAAFSPEAEFALDLCGFQGIPLIGYGSVTALAISKGVLPDSYAKPTPVQALAAIGNAYSGDPWQSLLAAEQLYVNHNFIEPFKNLPPATIHIFEDSPGGMGAMFRAVELIKNSGKEINLIGYGISQHPDKMKRLTDAGASVFPSVAIALRQALQVI